MVKATGLPTVRMHDLRHTAAAVALVDARAPLVVVSKRLGHASVAITADTYGHLLPDGDRDAAEAVRSAIPRKAS
jgi:integrase